MLFNANYDNPFDHFQFLKVSLGQEMDMTFFDLQIPTWFRECVIREDQDLRADCRWWDAGNWDHLHHGV